MTSRDKAEVWTLLRRHMTESLMASVTFAESTFRQITDGLLKEDIKSLRKAERALGGEKDLLKRVRRRQMLAMRRIDRNLALEKNTWFHTASNASEQLITVSNVFASRARSMSAITSTRCQSLSAGVPAHSDPDFQPDGRDSPHDGAERLFGYRERADRSRRVARIHLDRAQDPDVPGCRRRATACMFRSSI